MEKQLAELARKTPPSRSSYFGIIDLAGFPKDRYYNYQAHWRPELPMAHIFPHWNWPERVGQAAGLVSNCQWWGFDVGTLAAIGIDLPHVLTYRSVSLWLTLPTIRARGSTSFGRR